MIGVVYHIDTSTNSHLFWIFNRHYELLLVVVCSLYDKFPILLVAFGFRIECNHRSASLLSSVEIDNNVFYAVSLIAGRVVPVWILHRVWKLSEIFCSTILFSENWTLNPTSSNRGAPCYLSKIYVRTCSVHVLYIFKTSASLPRFSKYRYFF